MAEIIIFLAALCSVFLGCFQAINVTQGRHAWAAIASIAQGLAALSLYKTVPNVNTTIGILAFLVGGVLGGQGSMFFTRKVREPKR